MYEEPEIFSGRREILKEGTTVSTDFGSGLKVREDSRENEAPSS